MGWEMTLHKVFFLLCLEDIARHSLYHARAADDVTSKPADGELFRDQPSSSSFYYNPPYAARPLQQLRMRSGGGLGGRLGAWPLGIRRLRRYPRQQNLFLDEDLRIGRPRDPPLRPDPILPPALRQQQSERLLPEGLAVQDEKDNPANVSVKKEEEVKVYPPGPSTPGSPLPPSTPPPPGGPSPPGGSPPDGPTPAGMPESRKEGKSTEKPDNQLVIEVNREPSGGDAINDNAVDKKKPRHDVEQYNKLRKEKNPDSGEDAKGGPPPPKEDAGKHQDGIDDDKMTDEDKVRKMREMQKLMSELSQHRRQLINSLRKKGGRRGGDRKPEMMEGDDGGGPKMMRKEPPEHNDQEDDGVGDPMKKDRLRRLMKRMRAKKKKMAMLKDEKPVVKMEKLDSLELKGKGHPGKRRGGRKEGSDPGKEIGMLRYLMSKYGDLDKLKAMKTKGDDGKNRRADKKHPNDSGEHMEIKKKEVKVKVPDSVDHKKKKRREGRRKDFPADMPDSKEKKKHSGEKPARMESGEKRPKKDSIEKIVIVKKKPGDSGERSKGMRKEPDSAEGKKKKKLGKIPIESSVFDLSGRSPNFMQGSHPFARIMMMLDSAEYVHKILEFFGDLFIKEFKDKVDMGGGDNGGSGGPIVPPGPEPAPSPGPPPVMGSGAPVPEKVMAELQEDYGQNYKVPDVYF